MGDLLLLIFLMVGITRPRFSLAPYLAAAVASVVVMVITYAILQTDGTHTASQIAAAREIGVVLPYVLVKFAIYAGALTVGILLGRPLRRFRGLPRIDDE